MNEFSILENGNVRMIFDIAIRTCSGRKRILLPEKTEIEISPILSQILYAFHWQKMIDDGEVANLEELASLLQKDSSHVGRILRLRLLAPDIIRAAIHDTLPDGISLNLLYKINTPDWEEQKKIIGMI